MSDPQDHFHEPEVKKGYAVHVFPVRWKAYKPEWQRQMKRKGRWQRMNEYGGWENCEKPAFVVDSYETAQRAVETMKEPSHD